MRSVGVMGLIFPYRDRYGELKMNNKTDKNCPNCKNNKEIYIQPLGIKELSGIEIQCYNCGYGKVLEI